jgi:hypothetical protein
VAIHVGLLCQLDNLSQGRGCGCDSILRNILGFSVFARRVLQETRDVMSASKSQGTDNVFCYWGPTAAIQQALLVDATFAITSSTMWYRMQTPTNKTHNTSAQWMTAAMSLTQHKTGCSSRNCCCIRLAYWLSCHPCTICPTCSTNAATSSGTCCCCGCW